MAPPSRTSRTRAGGLRQAHRPDQDKVADRAQEIRRLTDLHGEAAEGLHDSGLAGARLDLPERRNHLGLEDARA